MGTMKAVQVPRAGADFELVERDIPEPESGEVRVRVEACGICHSDEFVKEGLFPGLEYPRVPGHEVVGRVDALGSGVTGWQPGERVGIGWHGGHCLECGACRDGDFVCCEQQAITGVTRDGGYAEYVIAAGAALARIPEALESVEAAPLLCAGITTYNALRHSGAGPGDAVAVQGLGGLGHLAVQYASRMGFYTIALSRGADKRALAERLGAHNFVDTAVEDPAQALQALGGARVILATAPSGGAMTPLIDGLSRNGRLVVVGASSDPIQVTPFQLIMRRRTVAGWPSGTARDSEDTLRFSALSGARTMTESYPLERTSEAYEHMLANRARFRVVLTVAA